MKKAIYLVSVLLIITFYFISYSSIEMNQETEKFNRDTKSNHIVALARNNSYNPILIIKND